jgi:hypothetical protein
MLYALEGEGKLFGISNQGRVVIDESGRTTFENSGGCHRLISVKADSMDISLLLNHLLASKEPLDKTHLRLKLS